MSFEAKKISNAQRLANDYAEARVTAAMRDFEFLKETMTDEEKSNMKLFLGRHLAKAYALGYCDGWEKNEPKKIYI